MGRGRLSKVGRYVPVSKEVKLSPILGRSGFWSSGLDSRRGPGLCVLQRRLQPARKSWERELQF